MNDSSEGDGNVAPEDAVEQTGSAGSGLFAVSPKLVDFAVTLGGRSQQESQQSFILKCWVDLCSWRWSRLVSRLT